MPIPGLAAVPLLSEPKTSDFEGVPNLNDIIFHARGGQ